MSNHSVTREDKTCITCGSVFIPMNYKLARCVDCHYLYKSGIFKALKPVLMAFYKVLATTPSPYELRQKRVTNLWTGTSQEVIRKLTFIKQSAKRRGLSFSMTPEHMAEIMTMPCYYCGVKQYAFSVDRYDNKEGYTDQNTVACCRSCNSRKSVKPAWLFVEDFWK